VLTRLVIQESGNPSAFLDRQFQSKEAIGWSFATYYPKRFWRKQAYIRFDDNCYGGA